MTSDSDVSTARESEKVTVEAALEDHDPRRVPGGGGRWWIWVVGATVLGVGVYAVASLALGGDSDAAVVGAVVNTAEVVRTDLADETIYEGTLGRPVARQFTAGIAGTVTWVPEAGTVVTFGEPLFAIDDTPVLLVEGEVPAYRDFRLGASMLTLSAGRSGVLTWLAEDGEILESGSTVARIDEVPLVLLNGETPMYRTLGEGDEGADVRQLEQALVDLGYDPDGMVMVDEEFTSATERMVDRWQEDLGFEETGSVLIGDVIFATVPGQVISQQSLVGSSVASTSPLLAVSGGSPLSGPDVRQLELALSSLGHNPGSVDGVYDLQTAHAVAAWTEAAGHGQDGRLPVGSVVFNTGGLRTADVLSSAGSAVSPSSPVISAAGLQTIVRLDLPAEDQELLVAGSSVVIVMPDRSETRGTVTFVSTVATAGGPGNPATFEVEIALDDPSVAAGLDEAPVDVRAVSEAVEDVLAVPVSALLALAEGGYALELVEGDGTRLVAIEPGFFADGLVEVTGDIEAGDLVVTP